MALLSLCPIIRYSCILMDFTEVVLGIPEIPKLKDLANSTRLAFSILRPWCTSDFQSNALIVIQKQAKSYVKAIDFSITAAQDGYNVTQEILTFSKLVDNVNEKQRQEYLSGMLNIARQGAQHSRLANEKFRNVRSMVGKLILDARQEGSQSHPGDPSVLDGLNNLEGGLSALEEFSSCISSYVSWWNVINMAHVAQTTRMDQIVVNYNTLRYRDVIKKWKELGQTYVEYSTEIQSIQDSYPDFAHELSTAASGDLLSDSEVRDDLTQEPIIVDSLPHNPLPFHFPGPLFASRYRDEQKRIRKRDRIREIGHKILYAIGAR